MPTFAIDEASGALLAKAARTFDACTRSNCSAPVERVLHADHHPLYCGGLAGREVTVCSDRAESIDQVSAAIREAVQGRVRR